MKKTRLYIRLTLIAALICLTAALLLSCADEGGVKPDEAPTSTVGLIYEDNGNGTYTVIGYEGEATDIVIDLYEGKEIASVGVNAFSGNQNITSVTLGASVSKIDVAAFAGCTGLASASYAGSAEDWSRIDLGKGNEALTSHIVK